ncbi:MAG: hypothetical protein WCY60_06290 [Trueperaceae bacterium]|jgi:hypothetical protein
MGNLSADELREMVMRAFLSQLSAPLAIGAGLALLLKLAEVFVGLPPAVRFFGGGALIVIGGALSSGASGSTLMDKGRVRGLTESDIREHVDTRRGNLAAGTKLIIIGAMLMLSQVFF